MNYTISLHGAITPLIDRLLPHGGPTNQESLGDLPDAG